MQPALSLYAGHTDSVEAVALSSALPVAATASIDGKVLVWDNATLSVRGTCEHPEVFLGLQDFCMQCCDCTIPGSSSFTKLQQSLHDAQYAIRKLLLMLDVISCCL